MVNNTNNTPNRLINEKSPYLLQHAYNPVDWYPWGVEAFSRAKAEDKPIFLSIGYSTCHWCHVMAHESFDDAEVAEALNKDFISIKVDKEERPDIDAVYMAVCQGLTGAGGWPLTIIMTPDQIPFFAGTYFPKLRRYNIPGIFDILGAMSREWKDNREPLLKIGNKVVEILQRGSIGKEVSSENSSNQMAKEQKAGVKNNIDKNAMFHVIKEAKEQFEKSFDREYGGFGKNPKFPTPHNLMFLLRYYQFEKEEHALEMVEKTLQEMYKGGIFDHIGYGFARYSTDNKWLVPHFEKMLYDNALLIIIYLEAYQITGKELYKTVAVKTIKYVLREMISKEGGFYSAQDADSEGVEGKYYVFTPEEMIWLLGEEEGKYFNDYFDISDDANFEEGSIPNLIENKDFNIENERINELIKKVYDFRLSRTHLHKDDKILTSWNSLMIVAFAKAYKSLGDESYLKVAEKTSEFISEKLTQSNNRLYIRYRDGYAAGNGTLDDYAFYIWALTELYEASFNTAYLDKALKLCNYIKSHFWDGENGGFYLTAEGSESLIYRPKETYDGAIPSGNSVAGYVLIKLSKLTGMTDPKELGLKQLKFLTESVNSYPAGYSFALMSFMMELYPESFLCENGVCS